MTFCERITILCVRREVFIYLWDVMGILLINFGSIVVISVFLTFCFVFFRTRLNVIAQQDPVVFDKLQTGRNERLPEGLQDAKSTSQVSLQSFLQKHLQYLLVRK